MHVGQDIAPHLRGKHARDSLSLPTVTVPKLGEPTALSYGTVPRLHDCLYDCTFLQSVFYCKCLHEVYVGHET
jgi:hypothetical protein